MDDNPLLPDSLDVVSAGAVVGIGVIVVALLVFVVVRLRSSVRQPDDQSRES